MFCSILGMLDTLETINIIESSTRKYAVIIDTLAVVVNWVGFGLLLNKWKIPHGL